MSNDFKMNEEDMTMPIGLGPEGGADHSEITFAEEKKPSVNSATLMLVGVFAAGLMVIYFLGMHNKPRAASAEQAANQARMDSAIASLLARKGGGEEIKNLFKDTDRLVAMFYNYPGGGPADDELPNNPFAMDSATIHAPDVAIPVERNNYDEQERLRKAADAFAQLKLESVIMGKRPMAMINHKIVTIGTKIGDFTVSEIEGQRVVLNYAGAKFELKLQRPGLESN